MKIKSTLLIIVIIISVGCSTSGYYYQVDPKEKIFDDDAFVFLAVGGKYGVNVIRGKVVMGRDIPWLLVQKTMMDL